MGSHHENKILQKNIAEKEFSNSINSLYFLFCIFKVMKLIMDYKHQSFVNINIVINYAYLCSDMTSPLRHRHNCPKNAIASSLVGFGRFSVTLVGIGFGYDKALNICALKSFTHMLVNMSKSQTSYLMTREGVFFYQ